MGDEIILVPYDERWPSRASRAIVDIRSRLGKRVQGAEHIGSTAVPGLSAKPVLDLLIGVASMAAADRCLPILCAGGWDASAEFNATLADRRFVRRRDRRDVRTHHAHLVIHESNAWRTHLLFRDRLRADLAFARRYLALKRALASKHRHDREAYTDEKSDFIRRALAR